MGSIIFYNFIDISLPSTLFIGMKNLPSCSICGKSLSDYRNKKCQSCHYKTNPRRLPSEVRRERKAKYKAKWFQKNKERLYKNYLQELESSPEKIKSQRFKYYIKSKFGICIETYEKMLSDHNHQCAICGYKQPEHAEAHDKLYVDHNHTTNEIRGLLCMNCNSALGHFREDLTILEKAVQYMTKYERPCNNTANQGH